jgi:hypothetical protein
LPNCQPTLKGISPIHGVSFRGNSFSFIALCLPYPFVKALKASLQIQGSAFKMIQ